MKSSYDKILILFLSGLWLSGCKKFMDVPPPIGTLTTTQVFSTNAQATNASAAMYSNMINSIPGFSSYGVTVYTGLSSDELSVFDQSASNLVQFEDNKLLSTNFYANLYLWSNAYSVLYNANAIISGLNIGTGVSDSVKSELTGESEFVRAFTDFYLTNLYGDIPLVNSVNYNNTSLLARTSVADVYQQIEGDLKDAQIRLAGDYSVGNGQRIIPNKWAATALLARVYLYQNQWDSTLMESNAVINNSLFGLTSLDSVFLVNSNEAIWQLQQDNTGSVVSDNATPEGFLLVPFGINSNSSPPFATLTPQLLNAFETDDQRKSNWVDSTLYFGTEYYFPYKYKVGPPEATVNGPFSEYYMVFRLAEQYLIRAEAEANNAGGGTAAAINDINVIRSRAGLGPYAGGTDQASVLAAIAQENRIEFMYEWGHRWFDLKRTGQATNVLSLIKPSWKSAAELYPIPMGELQTDPNLVQNPSY